MLSKVRAYVERNRMIVAGDFIVAGVSGGADSVCLLFILLELQTVLSFSLEVVHIDHGIRQESGEDADFVKHL
ncbi:MAG: tRNA(Ile)-lysidine synthetase, partial [Lachnospiraceae bacterium]|nr:tRNA(Ile)-lysidine synthetase [Lachnospiraceae bacterium]